MSIRRSRSARAAVGPAARIAFRPDAFASLGYSPAGELGAAGEFSTAGFHVSRLTFNFALPAL
jgi:hypothetical protein